MRLARRAAAGQQPAGKPTGLYQNERRFRTMMVVIETRIMERSAPPPPPVWQCIYCLGGSLL